MWTVPVLLWIFGSAWSWHFAQGGTILRLEDDVTPNPNPNPNPGIGDGMVTPGLEERVVTTGATGELNGVPSGKVPLVPTFAEGGTKPSLEETPTPEISDHDHEKHKSSTTVKMVTSHSVDKETSHPNRDNTADETQTTEKRDGLAVVTLVGIIVGVLLAIGFVGGIIIVVMKKISGRFSP
ncbi:podoplanin isoform X1 [Sigmodon hispidus]